MSHKIVTVTPHTAIDRVLSVPGLEIGQHLPGEVQFAYPGGKGINVSVVLARLDEDSIATGYVGKDTYQQFRQYLSGIKPGRIRDELLTLAGSTRENLTLTDAENQKELHIRTKGFEVLEQDVKRLTTKVRLLTRPGDFIVFSGSLPPGMEEKQLSDILSGAALEGGRLVIDMGGKTLRTLERAFHANLNLQSKTGGPWLVTPNLQELAEYAGRSLETEEQIMDAGRELAETYRYVVVTRGKDGALLISEAGAMSATLEIEGDQVQSTIGAGDSFVAGFIKGLMDEAKPEDCLRMGVAAATANCLAHGVGRFDRSQWRDLLESTRVG